MQYYREIKWDQINSPLLAIFLKPRKFAVRKRIKLHAMHSVENFVYISHKIICLSWEMWKILKPYLNFTWKVGIRAFSWARVRLEIACRDNISVAQTSSQWEHGKRLLMDNFHFSVAVSYSRWNLNRVRGIPNWAVISEQTIRGKAVVYFTWKFQEQNENICLASELIWMK